MAFASSSRHRKAKLLVDNGLLRVGQTVNYLGIYEPFRYQNRPDNLFFTARRGDTLHHIATAFYGDPKLYWAIADYQPVPILNPFIAIEEGRQIIVPSPELLHREILQL